MEFKKKNTKLLRNKYGKIRGNTTTYYLLRNT